MKISLIAIVYFQKIWAAELSEARFNLFTYDPHGKVLAVRDINITGGNIAVDGLMLSKTEVAIKARILGQLKVQKKLRSDKCDSGKYIFRMSANQEDVIESGCLGSKRYLDINNNFDSMKKDVILK